MIEEKSIQKSKKIGFLKQQLQQTRKELNREINERQQAQEALRISQEKLQLAFRLNNATTAQICERELEEDNDIKAQNRELVVLNEQLQITLEELRVAEEELRQQNRELEVERQRYRDLFNLAPDGYIVTDKYGKILEANQAIAKLLATENCRLVKKFFTRFIPFEDRHSFRTHLNNASDRDRAHTWELMLQSQDGKQFFAEATVISIEDLHHQTIGLRWLIRDISERKQMEEQLQRERDELEKRVEERTSELSRANCLLRQEIDVRKRVEAELRQLNEELELRVQRRTQQLLESEELFRHAFESAVQGMALVSLDGRWLKVNPALCQMLGYGEAEWSALTLEQITHPDDLEKTRYNVRQILTDEIPCAQLEKRYRHKLGHYVWVICGASLVRDNQGHPLHLVVQIQDITERRALEQMKSEFISIVSHELRTPLTSIRGSLGLLAAGVLDDEPETAKKMLKIAASESDRLTRLINDILDLERLESKQALLHKQWCDVASSIRQAMETMQTLASEEAIALVSFPLSAQIWVDPDRIVQVLVNLLSNAIKFSPANSTIVLTAEVQGDRILFQVQDRGKGIPSDKLETIFGRFQQIDASDARVKGGTGLGLAICRNIVSQHGGRIWVESVLGEGSTFYFTLPI
jgi:PAS domain S-box-containing protein